jgi:two-component system, OmpR family, response regulator PhoP
MRILLVEDDTQLREHLQQQLAKTGFCVDAAADGEEGLFAGLNYPLDAAIVDWGLPKLSGLEVIKNWRFSKRTFPVVILTARDGWQDKVAGLDAGADDYVAKPFSFPEVSARLRAVMRRSNGWTTSEILCGPYALNTRSHTLTMQGIPVELTNGEYRLLHLLMQNAGRTISATELAEHLYAEDIERESNIVAQLICRLRRKLDPYDILRPIETVYGGGYRFVYPREGSARA